MHLDLQATRALSIVGVTARCQVRGNPPDAIRSTLNDTRTAQRLQSPDMAVDDLVGMVAKIIAQRELRPMFRCPVNPVPA